MSHSILPFENKGQSRCRTRLHVGRCAVVVPNEDHIYRNIAEGITSRLKLEAVVRPVPGFDQFITVVPIDGDDFGLAIQQVEKTTKRKVKLTKPVYVDFGRDRKRTRKGPELLLQALPRGTAGEKMIVWDVCAGWGRDALVMASAGYGVLMVERNAVMNLLLEDGLRRKQDDDLDLTLQHGDAADILSVFEGPAPDVIYMDPMFPPSRNSALVKKDLQILHSLVGVATDEDAAKDSQLLDLSLKTANQRVIVKRPAQGEVLPCRLSPSFKVMGSKSRWDVYLTS